MIGVAILGGGFMGQTHAAAWAAHSDRARVRVVASRTVSRAQSIAAAVPGAVASDDLEAAIADPSVDVVDVCLPSALHRVYAERAFAAGKHVLVEKPLALSLSDAEAIVAAGERAGCVLLVGMVLRFWPEYRALHDLVASGVIGQPAHVSAVRLSAPPGWNDWMDDPEQSGGVAVDLMVHDFDQLNALLGPATHVHARAAVRSPRGAAGHVVAITRHPGGTGFSEGGVAQPSSYPFSSGIRVLGERGVLEYPFSAAPAADGGNIGGVDQAANRLRLHPADGPLELVAVESADPWACQAAYLLDCLETGQAPALGTGAQALAGLRVSLAANRSIASGSIEAV